MNDNLATSRSPSKLPVNLNKAGRIILITGFLAAGVVYWIGQSSSVQPASPAADGEWRDGSLSTADSKVAVRGIEQYGGPVEVLMVKFNEALKDPASQALLIATTSTLVAFGCFLAARNLSPQVKA